MVLQVRRALPTWATPRVRALQQIKARAPSAILVPVLARVLAPADRSAATTAVGLCATAVTPTEARVTAEPLGRPVRMTPGPAEGLSKERVERAAPMERQQLGREAPRILILTSRARAYRSRRTARDSALRRRVCVWSTLCARPRCAPITRIWGTSLSGRHLVRSPTAGVALAWPRAVIGCTSTSRAQGWLIGTYPCQDLGM